MNNLNAVPMISGDTYGAALALVIFAMFLVCVIGTLVERKWPPRRTRNTDHMFQNKNTNMPLAPHGVQKVSSRPSLRLVKNK